MFGISPLNGVKKPFFRPEKWHGFGPVTYYARHTTLLIPLLSACKEFKNVRKTLQMARTKNLTRHDNRSPSPSKAKPPRCPSSGGLFPTVALSDAVNTFGHAWAAAVAYSVGGTASDAGLGFALVAVASLVGTLRFGLSERLLAKANGDLADLAAFIGLPMVGLSFGQRWLSHTLLCDEKAAAIVALAGLGAMARSLPEAGQELAKVLLNVFCFVLPILGYGAANEDYETIGGVLLFAVAGLAVGADRHTCLLGMRRENWFHCANFGTIICPPVLLRFGRPFFAHSSVSFE